MSDRGRLPRSRLSNHEDRLRESNRDGELLEHDETRLREGVRAGRRGGAGRGAVRKGDASDLEGELGLGDDPVVFVSARENEVGDAAADDPLGAFCAESEAVGEDARDDGVAVARGRVGGGGGKGGDGEGAEEDITSFGEDFFLKNRVRLDGRNDDVAGKEAFDSATPPV